MIIKDNNINNIGIVYISFGKYVKEVLFSAKSAKKKCRNISTTLFTDINIDNSYLDNIKIVTPKGKRNKCDYLYNSPYDNTLYLDSDTQVNCNILEVYEILNKFDIALTHDFSRKSNKWSKIIKDYKKIPYSFSEFCGGVILFKKSDKVESFFKLWKDLYYKYKHQLKVIADQPSLRIALWNSDLRIHTLPMEYNVREQDNRDKWEKRIFTGIENKNFLKPRIYHAHGLNIKNKKIKMYEF